MKKIGLLGGMSLESTLSYITGFRDGVRTRLGGLNSPELVVVSVNFAEIEALQHRGAWNELGRVLGAHARKIERAGADFLLLATNTMHKVAPAIEAAITIPFVHIADATADQALSSRFNTLGLLGTRFTMEQDFYAGRLRDRGIAIVVPGNAEREQIHRIIYEELCKGQTLDESRTVYRNVMQNLVDRGAQAVILGCTEIGLLIGPQDCVVPVLDTTRIHIEKGLELALSAS